MKCFGLNELLCGLMLQLVSKEGSLLLDLSFGRFCAFQNFPVKKVPRDQSLSNGQFPEEV